MHTHITKHGDDVAFTSEGSTQAKDKPQGDDRVIEKIALYKLRKITERLET